MGEKASFTGRDGSLDGALKRDSGGEGADLVEIAGAIKWFDVAKGYGFTLPD
ncbi:cold-shock protein, partial [Mesorhizobium sp. M4A.F.Ca.ET.050.02.1.1]